MKDLNGSSFYAFKCKIWIKNQLVLSDSTMFMRDALYAGRTPPKRPMMSENASDSMIMAA